MKAEHLGGRRYQKWVKLPTGRWLVVTYENSPGWEWIKRKMWSR